MATIYDIAKVSGVSATTVSHVLNHTRYVSPDITQRVMEAVETLGYQPKHRRNEAGNSVSPTKRGSMGFFIDRQLLTTCGCRAYVRMARRYDWITISVEGPLTEKQLLLSGHKMMDKWTISASREALKEVKDELEKQETRR